MTDFIATITPIDAITMVASAVAFTLSLIATPQKRRDSLYQDLDGLYLEILKIGMDKPRFVNPAYTTDYRTAFQGDELHSYQTYAFIVCNVLETILDRRDDKHLFETWEPVVIAEHKLHRAWLEQPENRCRFKQKFLNYVDRHLQS